jgi:hypothetical protein
MSMLYVHGAVGLFLDLCLLALPISLVFTNMTFSPKMVQVILIFSVGIFAAAAGAVRLGINATTDWTVDATYKIYNIGPWSQLECHVGLWTACFPAMQPLIRWMGDWSVLQRIRGTQSEDEEKGRKFNSISTRTTSYGSYSL